MPKTLGIIPARGGSKGVPNKNARPLCGKPLLQYTIEAAQVAQRLDHVILSTDSAEIAAIGHECGVDMPFMRPADLAQDDTPMLPVIQHAVSSLEALGEVYDLICLLQPTSPLRDAPMIDGCIQLLLERQADSVFTVLPVPFEHNPHWVYFANDEGYLKISTGIRAPIPRRQLLPPAYHREGSVYVSTRAVVMEHNSLYGDRIIGYPVDPTRSVNIDTLEDWALAEQLICGSKPKP